MSLNRALVVGIGIALAVSASGNARAGQGKSQAELRKPFVGTWRLVSITGGNNQTRGSSPKGVIMYDEHGNMAVQIVPDRDRPKYTGTPTAEQAYERMRGYTAYFGTYTIDEQAQTVTHHRQGALDPGDVDFVRKFELTSDGNRVTLTPVGSELHLTWEKVR